MLVLILNLFIFLVNFNGCRMFRCVVVEGIYFLNFLLLIINFFVLGVRIIWVIDDFLCFVFKYWIKFFVM